ncbi:putative mitochondrial protein [Vitis vinifera]|nr:putative mitochondrial protein [Vitis vinifera]
MRGCLSTVSFAVLVNGNAKGWVKAFKGLRHGDPLSPFLFTLVADVLSRMLLRAEERNLLEGFRVGKNRTRVSHCNLQMIQFSFLTLVRKNCRLSKILLLVFRHISGLKVNLDKSNLYGINLDQNHLSSPKACGFWDPMIERILRRLDGWAKDLLIFWRPSLIPAKSFWPYLNPIILSLSLFSGHQSLFSEPREKTLSNQSNSRQKTLTAGNFSGELPGDGFFLHRKERLEEISNLSQSTGTRNPSTRRPRAFFRPATASHAPAREGAFSGVLGYFFSTPVPARALKSVLLPFRSMTKYGMASSQVSSVTSPESGGRSEIPNLGGNDSSPILITGHKLNGHNYLQWSQSVLLFICGKGKDEYLTGEAVMPETTEPGFRKWKIENSMIMSWLINSMNNDIGENFLLFGTAKDIWDAAKETYSSSENTSELFQVESALHDFRQGEQSVTQYYNTLTRYWQQLDLFETHSWKCSDDAATYRQIVEQKRLFKFFLGLNRELDDVRGRIMGIKPLPSLREAFSEVT